VKGQGRPAGFADPPCQADGPRPVGRILYIAARPGARKERPGSDRVENEQGEQTDQRRREGGDSDVA
jgi:hypothetical protein